MFVHFPEENYIMLYVDDEWDRVKLNIRYKEQQQQEQCQINPRIQGR